MKAIVALVIGVTAGVAHAQPAPAPAPAPHAIDPQTAQWLAAGVTVAGLGYSAYQWQHAKTLADGDGRAEHQLLAIAAATLTVGVGPMTGLLVGGARKRALVGGLGRPALIVVGGLGVAAGALVIGFGCFETDDCLDAKVVGGAMIGGGAALGTAAIAWAAYDLWDTPRTLRARDAGGTRLAPMVGPDRVGLVLSITR